MNKRKTREYLQLVGSFIFGVLVYSSFVVCYHLTQGDGLLRCKYNEETA